MSGWQEPDFSIVKIGNDALVVSREDEFDILGIGGIGGTNAVSNEFPVIDID